MSPGIAILRVAPVNGGDAIDLDDEMIAIGGVMQVIGALVIRKLVNIRY